MRSWICTVFAVGPAGRFGTSWDRVTVPDRGHFAPQTEPPLQREEKDLPKQGWGSLGDQLDMHTVHTGLEREVRELIRERRGSRETFATSCAPGG